MEEKEKSERFKKIKFPFFHILVFILVLLILLGLDFYFYKERGKSILFSKIWIESPEKIISEIMESVVKNFSPESVEYGERDGLKLWRFRISSISEARAQAFLIYEEIEKNRLKGRMEWDKSKPDLVSLSIFSGERKIALIMFEIVSPHKEEKKEKREFESKVAIVIDDIGYSLDILEEILKIEEPITLSVLPFLPNSNKCAERAMESGKEVIIHMPMESNNGNDLEMGIIREGMSEEEIRESIDRAIEFLPMAKGMNNHKGSKITRNEKILGIILGELKRKNLFFLDSKTSENSVAWRIAKRLDLPYAERDIFIDSIKFREIIRKNVLKLFKLAKKKGYAIGIAHPYHDTIEILKEMLPRSEDYDVKLVFLSEIVRNK